MRSVGRYELRTLLGQGSMGQVWQAWDPRLKRSAAIKIINPDLLAGRTGGPTPEDLAARFRREAELGARFTHPSLPTLYDAELDGRPNDLYLVWELILGQDLLEILGQHGGRLAVPVTLTIATQIADVLACIHEDPVVHRDLKPSNIVITEAWRVKVLDFGVAAVFGSDHPRLTHAGQTLGTVAYMAPEQFSDRNSRIGPQTDLYALGCLLYEMLTGQPPFIGDPASVMDGHRFRTPAAVRDLCAEVPEDVDDLIMKLLEKDAVKRPASARDIVAELTLHTTTSALNEEQTVPHTRARPATDIPPQPVPIRLGQAQALFDAGRFGDALIIYNTIAKDLTDRGEDHTSEAQTARSKAAHCHWRRGSHEQALAAYESLQVQLSITKPPKDDPLLLDTRSHIGILQEVLNQPAAAIATLADIYPLLREHRGQDDSLTVDVRAALNRLHQAMSIPMQTPAKIYTNGPTPS